MAHLMWTSELKGMPRGKRAVCTIAASAGLCALAPACAVVWTGIYVVKVVGQAYIVLPYRAVSSIVRKLWHSLTSRRRGAMRAATHAAGADNVGVVDVAMDAGGEA